MGVAPKGLDEHIPPPCQLMVQLRDAFQLHAFIETGTYFGNTLDWASRNFSVALSIEWSQAYYEAAKQRFAGAPNVELLHGDSKNVLAHILPKLETSALFWLDSHYSGATTAGADDQCPVLGEIAAIHTSPLEHVVLIDDARLFLMPPPPPCNPEQWPAIDVLLDALQSGPRPYFVTVCDDVIIAVPPLAKGIVQQHCIRRQLARAGKAV